MHLSDHTLSFLFEHLDRSQGLVEQTRPEQSTDSKQTVFFLVSLEQSAFFYHHHHHHRFITLTSGERNKMGW